MILQWMSSDGGNAGMCIIVPSHFCNLKTKILHDYLINGFIIDHQVLHKKNNNFSRDIYQEIGTFFMQDPLSSMVLVEC